MYLPKHGNIALNPHYDLTIQFKYAQPWEDEDSTVANLSRIELSNYLAKYLARNDIVGVVIVRSN
jgi:hypothetical protein